MHGRDGRLVGHGQRERVPDTSGHLQHSGCVRSGHATGHCDGHTAYPADSGIERPFRQCCCWNDCSVPFTIQVVDDGTIPVADLSMDMEGQPGLVALSACNWNTPSCPLYTDSDGCFRRWWNRWLRVRLRSVAVDAPELVTATFTGVGLGTAMSVVQQPGAAGVWVGDTVKLAVQVIGPGGTSPVFADTSISAF